MSARRLVAALLLGIGVSVAMSTAAIAHPLGHFSVNRYARIEVGPERTTLRYVLDLAEIPTLQELQAHGLSADAARGDVERVLLAARTARIAAAADLSIGARRAVWEVRDASFSLPDGQAGLRTMRIALTLVSALPATLGDRVSYRDGNEPGRSGWHEVVLHGVDGIGLEGSTAPAQDASDELRRYPADPTLAPPDVSSGFALIGSIAGADLARTASGTAVGPSRVGIDAVAAGVTVLLRAGAGGDLLAMLLALAAAAGVGAAHAITPGHGKTVMAAYLVGTRGTVRQAVALGGVVALSHTAGVLALGLVTLAASTVVAPERLYPYLSAASALVIVGIGVRLALGLRRATAHDHDHALGHEHDQDRSHHHEPTPAGWRSLVALGISGGLVPSASALLLLLAGLSLRHPELSVALVVAFGVGMAAVLVGVGLTLVGAGRLVAGRMGGPAARRVTGLLPPATTGVVLMIGVGLAVQAGRELVAALL